MSSHPILVSDKKPIIPIAKGHFSRKLQNRDAVLRLAYSMLICLGLSYSNTLPMKDPHSSSAVDMDRQTLPYNSTPHSARRAPHSLQGRCIAQQPVLAASKKHHCRAGRRCPTAPTRPARLRTTDLRSTQTHASSYCMPSNSNHTLTTLHVKHLRAPTSTQLFGPHEVTDKPRARVVIHVKPVWTRNTSPLRRPVTP